MFFFDFLPPLMFELSCVPEIPTTTWYVDDNRILSLAKVCSTTKTGWTSGLRHQG
jgi:hypothetical protein